MTSTARRAAIEETFRSLGHVMSFLQGCLRSRFSGEGVSLGQMGILRVLVKHGSATPKELADALRVTTGDVTGLVDKLEAAGLVTRRRSRQDRRVVHVEPTAEALERFKQMRNASIDQLSVAFEGWSLSEIQDFERMLGRLAGGQRPTFRGPLLGTAASGAERSRSRSAVRSR